MSERESEMAADRMALVIVGSRGARAHHPECATALGLLNSPKRDYGPYELVPLDQVRGLPACRFCGGPEGSGQAAR